jgi:hypothetical protein
MAVTGGLATAIPFTSDCAAYSVPDQFFKAVGGGEPTPEQRAQFKVIWETVGLMQAGGRLRNSPDTQSFVTVTDTAVELRVPCELPFPGQESNSAARGKLVLVSTEPELVKELNRLKSEANPENSSSTPSPDIGRREFKWRVVRLESDMVKVLMQQQPGQAGQDSEGMPLPGGR